MLVADCHDLVPYDQNIESNFEPQEILCMG